MFVVKTKGALKYRLGVARSRSRAIARAPKRFKPLNSLHLSFAVSGSGAWGVGEKEKEGVQRCGQRGVGEGCTLSASSR